MAFHKKDLFTQQFEKLLAYYYFFYITQMSRKIETLFAKHEKSISPIYFTFEEEERLSKTRVSYEYGWKNIERTINQMFTHVNFLKMLNLTVEQSGGIYFYQDISEIIRTSSNEEIYELERSVEKLILQYQEALTDVKWNQMNLNSEQYDSSILNKLLLLFNMIDYQFNNSSRSSRYKDFKAWFTHFCQRTFLKSRGRSGKMLILDTDYLLFLTKVIIKDDPKIRLKKLFEQFEIRGIIYDRDTQVAIIEYFEKLNLLEKKAIVGMLFMSKHFYSYLAHLVDRFLGEVNIQAGEKYHIQFEREEQVVNLVNQIKDINRVNPFSMSTEDGVYQSHTVDYDQTKVLIASNIEEITPDFLTTLRNKVGTKEEAFENLAMLLIHNSNLDSLVQGMTSFAKEGMPYHIDSIERDLQEMMKQSNLSSEEKQILNFSIESMKAQQGLHERVNLFDYENILTVLNNEKLDKREYKNFGLFYDAELFHTPRTPKEIKERLKGNNYLFSAVEMAHQYGNIETNLERHFDDSGVKALSKVDEWQEIDFGTVRRSNEKNLRIKF